MFFAAELLCTLSVLALQFHRGRTERDGELCWFFLIFSMFSLKASKRGYLQTKSTKLQVPFTVEDRLNKLVLGLT